MASPYVAVTLDVECPHCGAPVGRSCRRPSGRACDPHVVRAKRKQRDHDPCEDSTLILYDAPTEPVGGGAERVALAPLPDMPPGCVGDVIAPMVRSALRDGHVLVAGLSVLAGVLVMAFAGGA